MATSLLLKMFLILQPFFLPMTSNTEPCMSVTVFMIGDSGRIFFFPLSSVSGPRSRTFSHILSRRLPAPSLNEIEHNNNNSNYQQDMDEPSHRVTADQSQRPQNYQYHSNCPQHNDPPFFVCRL